MEESFRKQVVFFPLGVIFLMAGLIGLVVTTICETIIVVPSAFIVGLFKNKWPEWGKYKIVKCLCHFMDKVMCILWS
ncbi:MAG: hypothetical protein V1910_00305 [bacterium]